MTRSEFAFALCSKAVELNLVDTLEPIRELKKTNKKPHKLYIYKSTIQKMWEVNIRQCCCNDLSYGFLFCVLTFSKHYELSVTWGTVICGLG